MKRHLIQILRKSRLVRNNMGFSLLEVLIALFITGVMTTFLLNTYVNQHYVWWHQEQIVDAQQSARAALEALSRHVRMAGYSLPDELPGLVAANSNPDSVTIRYNPEECSAELSALSGIGASQLLCAGQSISCFTPGEQIYVLNPDSGYGEWLEVSLVDTSAGIIQATSGLSKEYPEESMVLRLEQLTFYIDASDTLEPKLMLRINQEQPEIYARNVEDMQFVYTLDNGATTSTPIMMADVREISLSLTARTSDKDPNAYENPYTYRTYASSVNLRNMGG